MAEDLKSTTEYSDNSLVERCKDGDIDAFDELVNKYKKQAYYFAYSMISNQSDAEDISQEAFVRVYKNIYKFKGKASFKTWFYRIIINLCRSHLRHRYLVAKFSFHFRQKDEMTDEPEKTLDTSIEDTSWQSSPVKAAINKELNTAIENAVKSLPKKQKEIFVLKHFQGLKISEVADILDATEGGIKASLFKAIKNLRTYLADYKQEVG